MATFSHPSMVVTSLLLFITAFFPFADAEIGVCYGMYGDNLPSLEEVVNLYKSNGIRAMRLYEPNQRTLQALQGSGIKVMLGVANNDLPRIASDQSAADEWVNNNVSPYSASINYVTVGNEIDPSSTLSSSVHPAMQNIRNALDKHTFENQIKVSTAINMNLTKNSYPPFSATFGDMAYITPIIHFLSKHETPLVVNIQPLFAFASSESIDLKFLLFTSKETYTDQKTKKDYHNLFDQIYDSVVTAVTKVPARGTSSLNSGNTNSNPLPQPTVGETGLSSVAGFSSPMKKQVGCCELWTWCWC